MEFEEDLECFPMGKNATSLFEKIIQNSLVTDGFLGFLPFKDILSCTLVSTEWKNFTRDHIRLRRRCLLKFRPFDTRRLDEFVRSAEQGNDILNLFKGLHFVIHSEDTAEECQGGEEGIRDVEIRVTPSISNLIPKLPKLKRVVFELVEENSRGHQLFLVWNFLFKLLPVGEIESLRFWGKFYTNWETLFSQVPENGFTKLKKFESECDWLTTIPVRLYESILKRCPALSEFYMDVDHKNLWIFKKLNKLSAVKNVRVLERPKLKFQRKRMKYFETAKLQLEIFHIDDSTHWGPEQFQCVARILELCSKSLRKFVCRHNTYQQIFNIQIPPMPWVEEVVVYFKDLQVDHPEVVEGQFWRDRYREDEENLVWKNHPHLGELFPNAVINPKFDLLNKTISISC